MRTLFKKFIRLINTIYYRIGKNNITLKKNSFYFVKFNITEASRATIKNSEVESTHIDISGKNNLLEIDNAHISKTSISITGINNTFVIEPEVKLRSATVHIRGNNCTIKIGKSTTFGGIRIVNVGINNNIEIGKNCLFADFIELWASDTHSIYDAEGNFINSERSVKIGNEVWVGSHVKILKGVTIGDGAVIGMSSIVTKNIAPKTLNVGNPLRCIKDNISWSLNYKKYE